MRGATVTLVTTADLIAPVGVEVVEVESAAQMQDAVLARSDADVIVMAAAVADFRPADAADQKIKKTDGQVPQIELEKTHDFLVELGEKKPAGQVLVGFAAETQNVTENARGKLKRKNLDLIVANDVSAPGAGFGHDTNKVTILFGEKDEIDVPMGTKRVVADAIFDAVVRARGAHP